MKKSTKVAMWVTEVLRALMWGALAWWAGRLSDVYKADLRSAETVFLQQMYALDTLVALAVAFVVAMSFDRIIAGLWRWRNRSQVVNIQQAVRDEEGPR